MKPIQPSINIDVKIIFFNVEIITRTDETSKVISCNLIIILLISIVVRNCQGRHECSRRRCRHHAGQKSTSGLCDVTSGRRRVEQQRMSTFGIVRRREKSRHCRGRLGRVAALSQWNHDAVSLLSCYVLNALLQAYLISLQPGKMFDYFSLH